MSLADDIRIPLRNADRFFIGGEWVTPSSDATIDVIDSGTEELFFSVAEAQAADIDRAVGAARTAFDEGPWPRMTHAQRAEYLRAIAAGLGRRPADRVAVRRAHRALHPGARRQVGRGDPRRYGPRARGRRGGPAALPRGQDGHPGGHPRPVTPPGNPASSLMSWPVIAAARGHRPRSARAGAAGRRAAAAR